VFAEIDDWMFVILEGFGWELNVLKGLLMLKFFLAVKTANIGLVTK